MLDGVASFLDELPPPERWECWHEIYVATHELGPIKLDGALVMIGNARDAAMRSKAAPVMVRVLGSTSLKSPHPAVVCDDIAIGRVAAKELLRRGHRDLAFVLNGPITEFDYARKRLEGFRAEAEAGGARFHLGPGTGSLRAFIRSLPRPCGVLAMTDETGKFVLDACRVENLRVPQDLAVLGVDNDLQNCELAWPPMASVQAGHMEVGYRAAQRLHARMNGEDDPSLPHIEIAGSPEVIVRASIDTQAIEDELVSRAMQLIRMHAHEPITVPQLCERLGSGRRSLELRFKRATGKSIVEELHWTRVEAAKRLLRNRRLSVERIAHLAGFGTTSHMAVIFRRIVGTTPAAYRKSVPLV